MNSIAAPTNAAGPRAAVPLVRVALITGVVCIAAATTVGMLTEPDASKRITGLGAAMLGAVPVFIAGLLGLWLFSVIASRGPLYLPAAVMATSVCRMLASLAGGLGMFLALSPDAEPFWISLLVCALGTLVIETKLLVGYMHAGPAKVAGG